MRRTARVAPKRQLPYPWLSRCCLGYRLHGWMPMTD
nr:MAG TPA: hypothetical protein [Caudoviricetes sp.]